MTFGQTKIACKELFYQIVQSTCFYSWTKRLTKTISEMFILAIHQSWICGIWQKWIRMWGLMKTSIESLTPIMNCLGSSLTKVEVFLLTIPPLFWSTTKRQRKNTGICSPQVVSKESSHMKKWEAESILLKSCSTDSLNENRYYQQIGLTKF